MGGFLCFGTCLHVMYVLCKRSLYHELAAPSNYKSTAVTSINTKSTYYTAATSIN